MLQLATAEVADAFQMLTEAESPLIQAATHAFSSSEGGLLLCLLGQRLNSSAVPPAVALGAAACPLQSLNDTAICCLTPAQPAGLVNVSVLVADVGYALLQPAVPQPFEYTAPPQLLGIAPAVGHVGSTVNLVGSGLVSGAGGDPTVLLGDAACAIVAANDTHVTCTATASPLGDVPVSVNVHGVGLASGSLSFTYKAVITAVSPANAHAQFCAVRVDAVRYRS